jgi:hypothetical protein
MILIGVIPFIKAILKNNQAAMKLTATPAKRIISFLHKLAVIKLSAA